MTSPSLSIRGVGLAASLGVSAVHAAAAARAGLSRPTPLELTSEDPDTGLGEPVLGHVLRDVTDGFGGVGRLWRLADRACSDLLSATGWTARDGAESCLWLHLRDDYWEVAAAAGDPTLPLPALRTERPEEMAAERVRFESSVRSALLPRLGRRLGIPTDRQFTSFGGAAETMDAILRAVAAMRESEIDRCIFAAVDSLADPAALDTLDRLGLLKTADNPVGLAPGEAASFLAIEERPTRPPAVGPALRLQSVVHRGDPERHRLDGAPPSGRPVAAALARTLGRPGEREAPLVAVSNFNGDPYGAAQWGDAIVHLRARGWPVDYEIWYPAVNFGDTGAAAAALGVCLAVRAFARGYNRGPAILVWSVSPNGGAGSCLVARADGERAS